MNPYDLGELNIIEHCQKIDINNFVRQAKVKLKGKILESEVSILGVNIRLATSETRFGGIRLWFSCPVCNKRVGVIYKHSIKGAIGCRKCLRLKYRKQRYKGMVETS